MPAERVISNLYEEYPAESTLPDLDTKSVDSGTSFDIACREHDCMTVADAYVGKQEQNGHANHVTTYSPVPSVTMTDKWGSYWSRRERCCCFWNFLLTVGLSVIVVIFVLTTKGVMLCNSETSKEPMFTGKVVESYPTFNSSCPPAPKIRKVCTTQVCLESSSEILSKMNFSADPCNDFYSYACGGFLEKTRLSWNSPRKRTDPEIILERHNGILNDKLAEDLRPTDLPETQVIKKVFKSCVEKGDFTLSQVQDLIESLGGLGFHEESSNTEPLTSLLSQIVTRFGVTPLFSLKVQNDGRIGITNHFSDEIVRQNTKTRSSVFGYKYFKPSDFFYRNEETDKEFQAYKTYIGDFLAYLMEINGTERTGSRFLSMIDNIYHLNVYMKRVFFTEETVNLSMEVQKCSKKYPVEDLQDTYNYNFSWRALFTNMFKNTSFAHNYTVCFASLSKNLMDVLSGFTYTTLKQYIIFLLLSESDISFVLPSNTPRFDKMSVTYGALSKEFCVTKTEQCCLQQISKHLPMFYVLTTQTSDFPNNAFRKLFSDMNLSLEEIIKDLYWIPARQKQYFLKELRELNMQLEWEVSRDQYFMHVLENVTSDYFQNMQLMLSYSATRFISGRRLFSGTRSDSSIINLLDKVIEIPISVLEAPLMNAVSIPSIWIGSIGTYISQAISQLFDIEALLKFLTEDKIDHRVALTIAYRLQCLLDEYSKYTLLQRNGQISYLQGDLTKSANFRDSLSLRVVYSTYQKWKKQYPDNLPGLELTNDQLFFISYAQSMCEKINDRGLTKFYFDTNEECQAPGKYRVIGTLSHFRKFADAFHCQPSSAMNPSERCSFL